MDTTALKQDIKRLMVENLMLQVSPDEIADHQPLFGPGSIGLDSVDALQLVVALDKAYGLKIADSEAARRVLHSVDAMAAAVAAHQNSSPPCPPLPG
jgi:acyl carrier protein